MHDRIRRALHEKMLDWNRTATLYSRLKNVFELHGFTIEFSGLCEQKDCNTAFHAVMKLPHEKTTMIFEISKLGPFARFYWKKKKCLSMQHCTDPPTASSRELHEKVRRLIEHEGVCVLPESDLCEPIGDGIEVDTPIGFAETVEHALFYFDGYVF